MFRCLAYFRRIMMKQLDVKKDGSFCYSIKFEKNFDQLADEIAKLGFLGHKLCIITDSNVAPFYLKEVINVLKERFNQIYEYVLPAGEEFKTLDQVKNIYEYLILHHFDRKDCLIALGGGVIGDMTGFTAATYLRGIDFIQVPTTLLSQVDSSIGGKTGVDFDSYKNMVGAFHMPRLVYMNLSVLNTLTEEQFSCGMGEILKHGLIKNREYLEWCVNHADRIKSRDFDTMLHMISESCKIKRDIVEKDPTEQGDRALLNFGHTLGHAVEKLMNFTMLHGQCVAVGCVAAMQISVSRGLISLEKLTHLEACFQKFGLPTRIEGITPEKILEISKSDKKMEAGMIKFILLEDIGRAYIDKTVTDQELLEASAYLLQNL